MFHAGRIEMGQRARVALKLVLVLFSQVCAMKNQGSSITMYSMVVVIAVIAVISGYTLPPSGILEKEIHLENDEGGMVRHYLW